MAVESTVATRVWLWNANGTPVGISSVLQQGQVLALDRDTDLTGYRIKSTHPVAVFSSHVCTAVGRRQPQQQPQQQQDPTDKCDSLYQQLLPVTVLGSDYVVCPTLTRPMNCTGTECSPNVFRYVPIDKNDHITSVTVTTPQGSSTDGVRVETWTTAQDQDDDTFWQRTTRDAHIVRANRPLSVYQYLSTTTTTSSQTATTTTNAGSPISVTGDPNMIQLVPVHQFLSDYTIVVVPTARVAVVTLTVPVDTLLWLDETDVFWVDATTCDMAAGSVQGVHYCCWTQAVAPGSHWIRATQEFGITVSGFGASSSSTTSSSSSFFAYTGGTKLVATNDSAP